MMGNINEKLDITHSITTAFLPFKVISDKGDPLRSPLTPLKKGGIIGKAGIFKCGNHLTKLFFNLNFKIKQHL